VAKIELGVMGKVDAKRLLCCVRLEPKLAWFAEALEQDIAEAESAPVAPWRKVVGKDRNTLRGVEVLECGHRYVHRYSKNWEEDWGVRRRCHYCLRAAAVTSEGGG
jgi:hypothetical protein